MSRVADMKKLAQVFPDEEGLPRCWFGATVLEVDQPRQRVLVRYKDLIVRGSGSQCKSATRMPPRSPMCARHHPQLC